MFSISQMRLVMPDSIAGVSFSVWFDAVEILIHKGQGNGILQVL